jgi:hypothetical protein
LTWSYNNAGLANSAKDRVRLLIGDTDDSRQQLQDEEIAYVLTQQTSTTLAAAACCDLLVAKYAFLVNTENGSLRLSAAARHKHYENLADRLRAGGAGEVPGDATVHAAEMYVGGSSVASKDDFGADSDFVQPPFRLGQDDHPEAWDTTAASV